MKIIADANIPGITDYFSPLGRVELCDSSKINQTIVGDADILLVRTVTAVNQALLANTSVRFVGSMTAGIDHLDTAWLDNQGITYAHAPGANAMAVVDYVAACIASLQQRRLLGTSRVRAGVIGVGRIGERVTRLLRAMGMSVICYDPPRAQVDNTFQSTPLPKFCDLDVLCLHPALTYSGDYPSYQLVTRDLLQAQSADMVLINASRGEVVNESDLLCSTATLCLDVWQHEPDISATLLDRAVIATPHIAGYSQEAKQRATRMVYQQCCEFFNIAVVDPVKKNPPGHHEPKPESPTIDGISACWQEIVLSVYNPWEHTQAVKQSIEPYFSQDSRNTSIVEKNASVDQNIGSAFRQLRQNYPLRREVSSIIFDSNQFSNLSLLDRQVLSTLGLLLADKKSC